MRSLKYEGACEEKLLWRKCDLSLRALVLVLLLHRLTDSWRYIFLFFLFFFVIWEKKKGISQVYCLFFFLSFCSHRSPRFWFPITVSWLEPTPGLGQTLPGFSRTVEPQGDSWVAALWRATFSWKRFRSYTDFCLCYNYNKNILVKSQHEVLKQRLILIKIPNRLMAFG